jgi:hypothetical protein
MTVLESKRKEKDQGRCRVLNLFVHSFLFPLSVDIHLRGGGRKGGRLFSVPKSTVQCTNTVFITRRHPYIPTTSIQTPETRDIIMDYVILTDQVQLTVVDHEDRSVLCGIMYTVIGR